MAEHYTNVFIHRPIGHRSEYSGLAGFSALYHKVEILVLARLSSFLETLRMNLLPHSFGASVIAQLVKNPPAVQETPVRFLGQEDPWEKGYTYPLQYF